MVWPRLALALAVPVASKANKLTSPLPDQLLTLMKSAHCRARARTLITAILMTGKEVDQDHDGERQTKLGWRRRNIGMELQHE